MPIREFQGNYRWLSNFAPVYVEGIGGLMFPSVEHAYQAAKTTNLSIHLDIMKASTAGKAKRLGRSLELFDNATPNWPTIKLQVMEGLLRQKFNKSPYKERLIATGTEHIEEGNRWGDTFWGVCNGVGENQLGKLIMKIRSELK